MVSTNSFYLMENEEFENFRDEFRAVKTVLDVFIKIGTPQAPVFVSGKRYPTVKVVEEAVEKILNNFYSAEVVLEYVRKYRDSLAGLSEDYVGWGGTFNALAGYEEEHNTLSISWKRLLQAVFKKGVIVDSEELWLMEDFGAPRHKLENWDTDTGFSLFEKGVPYVFKNRAIPLTFTGEKNIFNNLSEIDEPLQEWFVEAHSCEGSDNFQLMFVPAQNFVTLGRILSLEDTSVVTLTDTQIEETLEFLKKVKNG